MSKDKELGKLLQTKRLEHGWLVEQVATLYGGAIHGKPVTEGTIYMMEEGVIPKDPKRRWVLSRIFSISPVALGLKTVPPPRIPRSTRRTQPVDIKEFQSALHSYWTQGYQGQPETALVDLEYRINSLHDHVLYVRSPEKDQMMRLLCGFHMRRAEVARELSYDKIALDHVNKAVILAKEHNYIDLAATALYRRGEIAFDKWKLPIALKDFNTSLSFDRTPTRYPIPPQIKGRILAMKGLSQARLATTGQEIQEALDVVDASEKYINSERYDSICALNLTGERYYIDRAKSLVGPGNKKLHLSNQAEEAIVELEKYAHKNPKRFHSYYQMEEKIVQALIYLDRGYYPIATSLLQNALDEMKQMKSTIHLPIANRIYEQLQESSYGKSTEVAELGLQLLFLQIPQLFA